MDKETMRARWGVVAVMNFKSSLEYHTLKLQADFSDPKSDELHDVDELLKQIEEYDVPDDKYFSDVWIEQAWEEIWNLMGLNGEQTDETRKGVIAAANKQHEPEKDK